MRILLHYCAFGALLVLPAAAQPTITGLLNNYGYIKPGLPNYAFAPGAIIQVWGTNLGPASGVAQGPPDADHPLNTSLGGVTVNVTGSDGKTYQPIPYYVSATQINAILPSATPVGTGTITVKYNGQTSAGFEIQVVASAFGLLTLDYGTGPVGGYDVNYKYLGLTNALNPGEYALLWGTGLGASPDSETLPNTKFTDIRGNAKVWIGGQQATIQYAGRSAYPGLDQLNVIVPPGVSGCYVSVVVQNGNMVSNTGSIPVAASGRTCSDSNGFSTSDVSFLTGQGNVNLGFIGVGRTVTTTPAITVGSFTIKSTTTTTDAADATFVRYTESQLTSSAGLFTRASYGSCVVTYFTGTTYSLTADDPVAPTTLNAGASITMTGPSATYTLSRSNGYYSLPTSTTAFIPDTGGTFAFAGPGGADIGAFSTGITLAAPLVWSNMNDITTVDRTQGVTVNWTGGDANSFVRISGYSSYFPSLTDTSTAVSVFFTCTAPVSAKTFTVPPPVLLALPPSGVVSEYGYSFTYPGALIVSNYTNPVKFTASSLDLGYVFGFYTNGEGVTYK